MNDNQTANYELYNENCITKMWEFIDEGRKFDLMVFSPPFPRVFAYSDKIDDLSNAIGSDDEFLLAYQFVANSLAKLIKPGRLVCVHIQQIQRRKSTYGHLGLYDIRGWLIRKMEEAGFIYYNDIAIPKNPQAQSIRNNVLQLQFTQWERDSTVSRPSLADYLLLFKLPGTKSEIPVKPLENGLNRDMWIEWAENTWLTSYPDLEIPMPKNIWSGIDETLTLNSKRGSKKYLGEGFKPANTKFEGDEIHLCPLQLDLVERCILLWSNPGETVFTPFAGIGTEMVVPLAHGRNAVGCELNPNYSEEANRNCIGAINFQHSKDQNILFV